jgi:hypothetical protein
MAVCIQTETYTRISSRTIRDAVNAAVRRHAQQQESTITAAIVGENTCAKKNFARNNPQINLRNPPMTKCFILLLLAPAMIAQSPGFVKIASASGTSYVDTTCPNQKLCEYQVLAHDGPQESVPAQCSADQLCVATNRVAAPMPCSGTHKVFLTWKPSTDTRATYNVYRKIAP